MKPNDDVKNQTVADISKTVAISVEEVWSKASVPVVSHKCVFPDY